MEHATSERQRFVAKRSLNVGLIAYVVVSAVLFLFPIFWVVLTSFKVPQDILQADPFAAFRLTWDNYVEVFTGRPFPRIFLNSIIVTVVSVALSLFLGTLAAYVLARHPIRGKRTITFSVFLAKLFPPVILVVPLFVVLRQIGGTDNIFALALAYTSFNLPFIIWLMWGFFRDLPDGLEEAAAVDGCTRFGAMWRVMLPLSAPGLAVAAIFAAMNSWNEFLFALTLTGQKATTLPVMASTFIQGEAILWGSLSAAGTILMIPMFIFTLLVQRHLVAGLTVGAVK